jgi:hypothetical protein
MELLAQLVVSLELRMRTKAIGAEGADGASVDTSPRK